ncbi:MAG: acyltransferase [Thermodesulfobacteriota bacterium]
MTEENAHAYEIRERAKSFEWMLIAKGIGIILVVVGHFHPATSPVYWSLMRKIIYLFHMPLFFILSGYLYNHGKYSYRDLIKTKTKRLLYPFASIAGVFFLIKHLAGLVVNVDHPVNIESVYALLFDPVRSYMPLLWFVHALFLIFAVYPLSRVFMNNFSILFLLLVINVVFGSDYLVFGNALANMPFFVVGIILKENKKISKMEISEDWRYVVAPLVMFSLIYMIQLSVDIISVFEYPVHLLLGVAGSFFVISISHFIAVFSNKKINAVLQQIGYYSMAIYLFHTLFESTIRIGFIQLFKHNQVPFELIAFIAISCGVVFPLVLEKEVLRKNMITKKFVLGLT